jgi:hypothetical protein
LDLFGEVIEVYHYEKCGELFEARGLVGGNHLTSGVFHRLEGEKYGLSVDYTFLKQHD